MPIQPIVHSVDNAGTLAHLAVQAWIDNEGWLNPDPSRNLLQTFDEVTESFNLNLRRLPHAAATRSRLKYRSAQLVEILKSSGPSIRSELLLRDEAHHLFGILDIAGIAGDGHIIDLKTGRESARSLSNSAEYQLMFYAILFQSNYDRLPKRATIFNLWTGPIEIPVTPTSVEVFRSRILALQNSTATDARPAAGVCHFCPKRIECQPHWDAISTGESSDAIEGHINAVQHSDTGMTALQINGEWLVGVSSNMLPNGASPGQFVRVVRIRRQVGRSSTEWRTTRSTAIGISPKTQPMK